MKSNFESMEDMQRMQQEAVRRVQEMQKRAKQSLAASEKHIELNKVENPKHQQECSNNGDTSAQTKESRLIQNVNNLNENTSSKQSLAKTNGKMNIFSALLNDREKSLVLVLILILVDESSDLSLILALMYLII